MARDKTPVTPAVRLLRQQGVDFVPHQYAYEERGGTAVSARELGIDEHRVIKTLIMEDEAGRPLVVLMHGDLQVSAKELARLLGVKSVKAMPIYLEETIRELPTLFINGGKRGFLVEMTPAELERVLQPIPVRVGI